MWVSESGAMDPLPRTLLRTSKASFFRSNAITLKLLFVTFLVLLMLLPLGMIDSKRQERGARYNEAVTGIMQTWGKSQRLLGPMLIVPYTGKAEVEEWITAVDGRRRREKVTQTITGEAVFLPEQLQVTGELEPTARQRGIYRTHVYAAKVRLSGRFGPPDLAFTGVAALEPQWDRARVGFAISDLRGTREALALKWKGADAPLQPGARLDGFGPGLHAPVKLISDGAALEFALELTLNGSEGLSVVPLGRQTDVRLSSAWPDPGFQGSFLPIRREVTPNGFEAVWQVSHYGRDFPQQWTNLPNSPAPAASAIEASAFGVTLVQTVTAYRTIERAIKYGALFLSLVFATFFLFEVVSGVRLNGLNYLLVGAALCLFYLGLLSLSEFFEFTLAYAAAAGASLLLVGCYSCRVLTSVRRALLVTAMLAGVYSYLYFVLQMEDYALLAGTGALFALLAAVMYATRQIANEDPDDTDATAEAVS